MGIFGLIEEVAVWCFGVFKSQEKLDRSKDFEVEVLFPLKNYLRGQFCCCR